jgi:ABC-2 type transport system ATP-binding protein
MIEVQGLTKRYGEKTAVDGLTFGIEPGMVTGFLGPERGRQDHYNAVHPRA